MSRRGDEGYAIVVAVAAVAVFAAIAFAIVARDRGDVKDLQAQFATARLEAAADAGLVTAAQGLAIDDVAQRWPIDGRPRQMLFEGVKLTITIEDEQGKVPTADLTDEQVRRLFRGAGARNDQLDSLVDAYQDWMDDDDEPRPHGAEAEQYAAQGIHPRNGPPPTIDELARLKGITPEIFARIRSVLTPYFGISGGFNPRTASTLATAVLSEGGENGPEVIERQRELEGERTALEIAPDKGLAGRNLTVAVAAQDGQGASLTRRAVIVMTGRSAPAFFVRELR